MFCQSSKTQLSDILHLFDPKYTDPDPVNLVHIVNMYPVAGQLDNVQRATLDSMQAARTNPLAGKGNTTFVQVPLRGDEGLLDGRDGVELAPSLERTVLDIADFQDPRPLPDIQMAGKIRHLSRDQHVVGAVTGFLATAETGGKLATSPC